MPSVRTSYLLLITIPFGILCARQTTTDTDSRAVRDVVARYVLARNNKDATAISQLFTSDADQLVSTGEWRKGLDALIQGTRASSSKEKNQSSIAIEDVRFVEPAVAIVDGRYRTISLNGQTRNMWTTLILKRTEDGWRITAIRNMLPSSPNAIRNTVGRLAPNP